MNLEINRDLAQKASLDAFDAIMRTCALAEPDSTISIYVSVCVNLINSLISHLRKTGMREDQIAILVESFRESIDNLPEDKLAGADHV